MGKHTSLAYTDLKKKNIENIETAEEIISIYTITSLIQTSRLIWPQLATDANLELTIKQLGLCCISFYFVLVTTQQGFLKVTVQWQRLSGDEPSLR